MTPCKLNNSLLFSDIFLYLFFFSTVGKEAVRWWEIVREDVGCVGATAIFIALWCNNRGGKVGGIHRHGKKPQQKQALRHPTPRTMHPLHCGIRQLYAK
jgi:hypothetical protein